MKTNIQNRLYTLLLLLTTLSTKAQMKVGDNPTTINANSVLELESTGKGLLLPRLALTSTTAVAPLSAHVAGMTAYNTATTGDVTPGYYYNDGIRWVRLATASNFWSLTGNAGTSPGSSPVGASADANYWGTSDAQNLVVGTNGIKRMLFDQRSNAYGGTSTTVTSGTATNSFAWGSGNTVVAENSATFGLNNSNQTKNSLVFGQGNTLGPGATAQTNRGTILGGGGNTVTNGNTYNSIINGSQVTVTGDCFESIIIGFQTTVTGSQKVVVSGQGHTVTNALGSAVFGNFNSTSATEGLIAGTGNVINAGGDYGVTLGQGNSIGTGHANSLAIGSGATTTGAAQFVSGYAGGYRLYTNSGNTIGVSLAANGATFTSISDRRSKENISNLGYGLKAVMALHPAQYNYKGVRKISLGFIAQEVKVVLPEVVEKTDMGPNHDYLGINYTEMIPVLTKAIQELKVENDLVKARNASLATEVASLKAGMQEVVTLTRRVAEMQVALGLQKAASVSATVAKTPATSTHRISASTTK